MSKKYDVIALYGASGAGKDTILNWIVSHYPKIHPIISCTTRPPREGEVEGKDYYFITDQQMLDQVASGEMLEATQFRGWFYGTQISALSDQTINIGVFNPAGLCALRENPNINLITIFVTAFDKTRIIRCLNRESNPDIEEIFRRYKTDKADLEEYHNDWGQATFTFRNDDDMINFNTLTCEDWERFYMNPCWTTIFKLLR